MYIKVLSSCMCSTERLNVFLMLKCWHPVT